MLNWLNKHWPETGAFVFFLGLTGASLWLPFSSPTFLAPRYATLLNTAASIGTGGLVSFAFYYLVNARSERRRRRLLWKSIQTTYQEAKRHIAMAVIHASQKGGRIDLTASSDTVDKMMKTQGFKELFERGRELDEGYYAFMNQMNYQTPEYSDIIFNLKVIARATDRIVDHGVANDARTYDFFVNLSNLIERIERNGPGYDESKQLCNFIWEMFSGWNFIDGDLGQDPIEKAIEKLKR